MLLLRSALTQHRCSDYTHSQFKVSFFSPLIPHPSGAACFPDERRDSGPSSCVFVWRWAEGTEYGAILWSGNLGLLLNAKREETAVAPWIQIGGSEQWNVYLFTAVAQAPGEGEVKRWLDMNAKGQKLFGLVEVKNRAQQKSGLTQIILPAEFCIRSAASFLWKKFKERRSRIQL